jgi:hypothetical protein
MKIKYYNELLSPEEWRRLLADPEMHWKNDKSARLLAYSWCENNGFPKEVESVLIDSEIPIFKNLNILFGFPEYKVSIQGGSRHSQNDLYLYSRSGDDIVVVMVEGKVDEPFDKTVNNWLKDKKNNHDHPRLLYLKELLNIQQKDIGNIYYQLLHRTASVIIESKRVKASHGLVLIHSFSEKDSHYDAYRDFLDLFNLSAKINRISGPVLFDKVSVYFTWIKGDYSNLKKKYGSYWEKYI